MRVHQHNILLMCERVFVFESSGQCIESRIKYLHKHARTHTHPNNSHIWGAKLINSKPHNLAASHVVVVAALCAVVQFSHSSLTQTHARTHTRTQFCVQCCLKWMLLSCRALEPQHGTLTNTAPHPHAKTPLVCIGQSNMRESLMN